MLKSSVAKTEAAKPEAAQGPPNALTKSQTKVVRGSFKMPRRDFELIAALKERSLAFNHPVKKNELLRAGLNALQNLSNAQLGHRLDALMPLKAKSPKKCAD